MNMKYAMRSEDTEQINVVSWADWNRKRYPELKWLFHVPNGGGRTFCCNLLLRRGGNQSY